MIAPRCSALSDLMASRMVALAPRKFDVMSGCLGQPRQLSLAYRLILKPFVVICA
jgi:hypothetical protein